MQTFLPFADFREAARVLDWRRLGKQRVEAKQINKALRGEYVSAWNNHPAVLMWKGYENWLCEYAIAICVEWRARGFADAQLPYFAQELKYWEDRHPLRFVSWLGDPAFHASHRSNLLRKDPEFYGQYGWTEGPDLPYVWPSGFQELT